MCKSRKGVSVVQLLLSARFLLAAIILVFTATGLRPGMRALAKYYEKESIEPRRPLAEFDVSRLPSFRKGWEFPFEAMPEGAGTNKFVYQHLKRRSVGKGAVSMHLLVTYYSDPGDKVPHTPDVCYRQMGAVVKKMTTILVDTPQLSPEHPQTEANLLVLLMPDGSEQIVLFCFYVEGSFTCRRDVARLIIGRPGNRYTYFSKIETASNSVSAGGIELCKSLLSESLELLVAEYFPRKEGLKRR